MPNVSLGSAYSRVHKIGGNPRATEARAFMEAARRLSEAQKIVDDEPDTYRAALRLNWRLWTIIQTDVSGPDNPLPADLKANVISLSIFVDKHTLSALGEPAASKLDVLIIANVMAIAAREAAFGDAPLRRELATDVLAADIDLRNGLQARPFQDRGADVAALVVFLVGN